jgi:hypothetical protein
MWCELNRWHFPRERKLFQLFQNSPRLAALGYAYEKGGLQISSEPIPWNADAVFVEALVEWSGKPLDCKNDFDLHLADELPLTPISLDPREEGVYHVVFRLAAIQSARAGRLHWRSRQLGSIELPYVSRENFLGSLLTDAPTVFARCGGTYVACRSMVEGQAYDLIACTALRSPSSLLPLLDAGLALVFSDSAGKCNQAISVPLTREQLLGREAMLLVPIFWPSGMAGFRSVSLTVAGRVLAHRDLRVIPRQTFFDSLYVPSGWSCSSVTQQRVPAVGRAGTRLYLHLASHEPGILGLCPVEVRLRHRFRGRPVVMDPQEVLVSDVPSPCLHVSIAAEDLRDLRAIDLFSNGRFLGSVAWDSGPAATFTAEGGFLSLGSRSWTPIDEVKLEEHLNRLARV